MLSSNHSEKKEQVKKSMTCTMYIQGFVQFMSINIYNLIVITK